MKIGMGFDSHKLVEGRKLILGGIEIPYSKGLLGHSDADALIHSICDALLGAAHLGDIGEHFPDTNPKYKGISSLIILKETLKLIKAKNYKIINIDATIFTEEPKLSPYKKQMEEKIAETLNIDKWVVNIKAKTNEKMGFIGRKEGIFASAIVLLE